MRYQILCTVAAEENAFTIVPVLSEFQRNGASLNLTSRCKTGDLLVLVSPFPVLDCSADDPKVDEFCVRV